ncbi:hypothetical protein GOB94_11790 [Granulicella sp. 5B5]|nr:hypothetical protein GOB94_11790 [Granulicella sp. 5B5]
MGAAEIAVAASCGCSKVSVFARPKVAIVATGDELVELGARHTPGAKAPSCSGETMRPDPEGSGYLAARGDTTSSSGEPIRPEAKGSGYPIVASTDVEALPSSASHLSSTMKLSSEDGAPGGLREFEIYNSNSYAVAALVRGEGGVAARLAIARDSFAELKERVERGMQSDLLVLSGGVSMGKYDLVEQVLAELGAEFLFTGAKIQPGKPVVFGRLPTFDPQRPWVYFFGLPGNPVSTQVCFALFVAPMLRALAGRKEVAPVFVEARLGEEVKGGAKVTRFLPAELVGAWDGVTVRVVVWQGSGDVAANARGNCYCVLPVGVESFAEGDVVRVLLR